MNLEVPLLVGFMGHRLSHDLGTGYTLVVRPIDQQMSVRCKDLDSSPVTIPRLHSLSPRSSNSCVVACLVVDAHVAVGFWFFGGVAKLLSNTLDIVKPILYGQLGAILAPLVRVEMFSEGVFSGGG